MTARVLILEDEEAVALTLSEILADVGYRVEAAATVPDALARIDQTRFDAAVLDLRVGDDSGLDALARLRQRSPDTVALVLTGYGSLETAVLAMREGAFDYLLKPCNVDELKASIARGLEQRRRTAGAVLAPPRAQSLQPVFDQLSDGVVFLRAPDGEFMAWNQAAAALLGPLLEGRGLEAWRGALVLRTDGTPCPYDELPPVVALRSGETVLSTDLVIGDERLGRVAVSMSAVPVVQDGEVTAATLLLRAAGTRSALAGFKDEHLSLVAHELKTPLTTIKGNTQLLLRRLGREDGVLPPNDVQALRRINDKAAQLDRLINSLIDLTQVRDGQLPLRPGPVELGGLLYEAAAQQRELYADHAIELALPEGPVEGEWDRERLEQVFTVLLDNACRYSGPGAPVRAELEVRGGAAVVRVQDRGPGILPEELPFLFTRHFRGSNTGRSSTGLGIGLYLANAIVQRHGGVIAVETAAAGGSTFTVTLPLTHPQPA